MDWTASWIWLQSPPAPTKGTWMLARKRFTLSAAPRAPRLHLTADSRYVLWVNGERLGFGPIRSWPQAWHYDSYDLTGRLQAGENEIRVLVMHYGVGTFQYLPTRGGLLAQLEWETEAGLERLGTDGSWEIAEHPGYDRRTPRISCQLPWVEHFDARAEELPWQAPAVLGPVGMEPWSTLLPRPIPFLTEEPVYPVRLVRPPRLVAPPQQIWALDLRPNLLPGYLEANRARLDGYVATVVSVDAPTEVTLEVQTGIRGPARVNGVELERLPGANPFAWGGRAKVTLQPGDNLFLADVSGDWHEWSVSYVLDAPQALTPRAPLAEGARFATIGPVTDPEARRVIWQARSVAELEPYRELIRPIAEEDVVSAMVLDEVTLARPLDGAPTIDGLDQLCAATPSATMVHPAPAGADIELILDLGKMTVGFWELDLEAEAGVTLDIVGFESIQEGVLDYTWNHNNVMRYVTREGRQRYTSALRRGARYLTLTLRGVTRPLTLYTLRTLLSTYPVVARGSFLCNDWALNRIWQIGQYTTRLCSEDTYVDCPTYEQTFWVGDARNESLTNFAAFGAYDLTRHCLELVAPSLRRSALAESQVPSAWQNVIPAWSFFWVMACEEYYQHTGDRAFLERIYPALREQGLRAEGLLTESGLLSIEAWSILDWAPMDTPSAGIITHQNVLLVEAYRRTARVAEILGKPEDAARFHDLGARVYAGINAELWDPERDAYIDSIHADGERSKVISQQTNAVALLCECVPAVRQAAVRKLITDPPEWVVHAGSPFILFFILEAYERLGLYDLMLDSIRRFWGWMIDRDATTCWETFPNWEQGGRWTRSHCHAWSAAPTWFLTACQLGVTPQEPGYTRARIAPQPANLRWARGRVPTPHGEIEVSWSAERADWRIEVALPPGVAADVVAPPSVAGYREVLVDGDGAWQTEQGARGAWTVHLEAGANVAIRFR